MAMSGTQRQLISDTVGWVAIAGMLFYTGSHFDQIRTYVAERAGGPAAVDELKPAVTPEAAETPRSTDGVELAADRAGHYAATIEVNGRRAEALIDTGATLILLTYEDARRAGIFLRDSDFTLRSSTANGISKAAPVTLERVTIGSITVRDVEAAVAQPGRLHINLLGMSFLQKLRSFEIHSGHLILKD